MFNCLIILCVYNVIKKSVSKLLSLCNTMWHQNIYMKVKMEGCKQVITNMYDLLNGYQTTMFSQESQVQQKNSVYFPVRQSAGNWVQYDSPRREINSKLNTVKADCSRIFANFEVQ